MDNIIKLTDKAIAHAKKILADNNNAKGLYVAVIGKGCSGNSYKIDYYYGNDSKIEIAKIIEQDGIKLFIDKMAMLFIIGSIVDYESTDIKSGFVFNNPNVKSLCGCGESFSVD